MLLLVFVMTGLENFGLELIWGVLTVLMENHSPIINIMPAIQLQSDYISIIKKDTKGNLWIGTARGIEVFDRTQNKFTQHKSTINPNSLSHPLVTDSLEDSRGLIWVGTKSGLNVFDKKTNRFQR